MVNLQENINEAISSGDVSNLKTEDLQSLVKEFPYCGIFRELLAKVNYTQKAYNTEKSFSDASVFISNRNAFFDFVFQETLKSTLNKVEKEVEGLIVQETPKGSNLIIEIKQEEITDFSNKLNLKEESFTEETAPTKKPSQSEPKPISEKEEPSELKVSNDIELKTKSSKIAKEEAIPEEVNEEKASLLKALETQIIASAVSSSIQKEAEEIEKSETIDEESLEASIPKNEKLSFSQWLKNFDPKKSKSQEKAKNRSLVEKFIQNDPQITPKQTQFFSAPEQAKLSLAENELFVTETLAEIYAKQGNVSKAIKAFEILMNKIPEKKVFFAGRIKELKSSQKK